MAPYPLTLLRKRFYREWRILLSSINLQSNVGEHGFLRLAAASQFQWLCYRGEPWDFTVERAYDIDKAEGSFQTKDEGGYDDYRVKVELQGSLTKLNRTQQTQNGRSRDSRLSGPKV